MFSYELDVDIFMNTSNHNCHVDHGCFTSGATINSIWTEFWFFVLFNVQFTKLNDLMFYAVVEYRPEHYVCVCVYAFIFEYE